MPEISRRAFTKLTALSPFGGILRAPPASSIPKPLRFQIRCHQICIDGTHIADISWRLGIHVRVIQRKESDIRYWRARIMEPTPALAEKFQQHDISVVRQSPSCWLTAERVPLPNGVIDLLCLLNSHFPPDWQAESFVDSHPEWWGEYTVLNRQIVKHYWMSKP